MYSLSRCCWLLDMREQITPRHCAAGLGLSAIYKYGSNHWSLVSGIGIVKNVLFWVLTLADLRL